MNTLSLTLTDALAERLQVVAQATDRSVADCLSLAVQEFVDHWEGHLDDLRRMDEGTIQIVVDNDTAAAFRI